jgi:transglutaminase-like putative cysteine protease
MNAREQPWQSPRDTEILLLLAAVFAPFALWMPLWVSCCFLALLLLRAALPRWGRGLPSRPWRVLLALAGLGAVIAFWGSPFGLRAGTALFLLMIAVKSFEQTAPRDRKVTVLLCCFLLLAGTLFSRSLPLFLYDILLLAAILFILQRLQHSPVCPTDALARTGKLLLQALPLAVILFLLFPRIGGGLISLSPTARSAFTGLSRTLSPGDVANLVPSEEVAFRVRFRKRPDLQNGLYWRSLVLTRYDGSRWFPSEHLTAPPPPIRSRDKVAEYSVDLEPTGKRYLPALDLPLDAPKGAEMRPGYSLRREEKVSSGIQYSLRSATRYRTGPPRRSVRAAALAIGHRSNPRTRALVRRLKKITSGPRELVDALLQRFAEGDYVYTRNPPLLRERDPVDHFLFQSKQGFCGHYAQALTWAARAAGIPARIVTGYMGGERNPLGDYWIVRQSDAHAWVEVFFPGKGWVRKDPTRSLSPDQILGRSQGGTSGRGEGLRREALDDGWLDQGRRYAGLAWDAAQFGWNYYVLGFTQQRQLHLLARLRLGNSLERALPRAALLLTFLFLCFMLILAAMLLKKGREASEVDRIYRRFQKKVRRAGIGVHPAEGPLALSRRIETERPDLARSCREILRRFTELRYAERGSSRALRSFRRSVRRFRPAAPLRRIPGTNGHNPAARNNQGH